jgi:hypothetical protein
MSCNWNDVRQISPGRALRGVHSSDKRAKPQFGQVVRPATRRFESMPWLPYLAVELESEFEPDEAIEAIRAAVEPKKWLRLGTSHRPFEGEVLSNTFQIQRIIGYRNSFLPRVDGKVSASSVGSRIKLEMRLSTPLVMFMIFWLGMVAIFVAVSSVEAIRGKTGWKGPLTGVGMFAFAWGLVSVSFSFEAKKAEKILARRTQARRGAAEAPHVKPEGFY